MAGFYFGLSSIEPGPDMQGLGKQFNCCGLADI